MALRRRHHVFVCDNTRNVGTETGRPSCGASGGRAVLEALRCAVLADPELCATVAVTGCDCLGPCFEGPNVVVYPEGIWYRGVTLGDVSDIVSQHLRAGTPVAPLIHPGTDEDQ